MSRFLTCLYGLTWQPQFDGQGYHVTAGDPGADTSWGVILASYAAWRRMHGFTVTTSRDLMVAPRETFIPLIETLYWNGVKADSLPVGVDLLVYDFGYGSGQVTSIEKLQQVVGVKVDGQLGPITLKAVNDCHPSALVLELGQVHEDYYKSLGNLWSRFGRGWTNRNNFRVSLAMKNIVDGVVS